MVWRSASLRYETSEKKLNEIDFISQGVKLLLEIPSTIDKNPEWKYNVRLVRRWIKDYMMVVKEIEDLDGENKDDSKKRLVMVNEEGWMS
ncbi:hypothetical protein Tco_0711815 [Tanacetum coccineum]